MNLHARDENDFTEAEISIIKISINGWTRKVMAKFLDMNFDTLCDHLTTIFDKLRIHRITELAMYALRMGYAEQ